MRITIIGSSHGWPEPGRKCTCIMVETGGKVYFVDMGTPVIEELTDRGIPVEAVQGIFITHMHGDHTNGLIPFADLLTWHYKEADPVICLPVIEAADAITAWIRATLSDHERKLSYRETRPGAVFDDGTVRMTAVPTRHCDRSYGYVMEAEGKTVVFTGDFKSPGIDLPVPDRSMHIDLLVGEGAHFDVMEYADALDGMDIGKFCINHYSDDMRLATVLELRRVLNEKGLPTVLATDGLIIEL